MTWPTASATARNRLVESLAQQLSDLIHGQGLQAGDRLPTVRALAQQLQVAVPTLREAIRRLEAFGVVDIRHGSGIFVRSPEPRYVVAGIARTRIDDKTVIDLVDSRLLFEPYCAERAAESRNPEELARLEAYLNLAEKFLGRSDRLLQEQNMAFHVGVARVSGNVVLAHVMESLADIYSTEQAAMLAIGNARVADYQEHRTILEAIQAGDATRAREGMRQHLLNVKTQMCSRLTDDGLPGESEHQNEGGGQQLSRAPVR